MNKAELDDLKADVYSHVLTEKQRAALAVIFAELESGDLLDRQPAPAHREKEEGE